MIYAQSLLPFFRAEPLTMPPLALAWAVILESLRRAAAVHAFYTDDLAQGAAVQARMDYPLARRGDRAAMRRLRIMWAVAPRPPVKVLPLP